MMSQPKMMSQRQWQAATRIRRIASSTSYDNHFSSVTLQHFPFSLLLRRPPFGTYPSGRRPQVTWDHRAGAILWEWPHKPCLGRASDCLSQPIGRRKPSTMVDNGHICIQMQCAYYESAGSRIVGLACFRSTTARAPGRQKCVRVSPLICVVPVNLHIQVLDGLLSM